MKKLLGIATLLAATLILAGPVAAQGKGKGKGKGFGGGGQLALFMNKDVQKDLKLSDEQVSKFKEVSDKQREAFKEIFALEDKEERGKRFKELNEETQKTIEDTLNAEQNKRYEQLRIQQQGAGALVFNQKLKDKLDLSQDQKDKIQEIFKEAGPKFKELFTGEEDKEARMKKMAELQKGILADALKVLNEDQRKTYEDMRGAPFQGTLPPAFGFGMGMGMGGGGGVSLRIEASADRPRRMRDST